MFLKGIPLLREPLPKSKSSTASRNKAILEKLRFFEVLFLANSSSTVGSKACTYKVLLYKINLGLDGFKQFDQKYSEIKSTLHPKEAIYSSNVQSSAIPKEYIRHFLFLMSLYISSKHRVLIPSLPAPFTDPAWCSTEKSKTIEIIEISIGKILNP